MARAIVTEDLTHPWAMRLNKIKLLIFRRFSDVDSPRFGSDGRKYQFSSTEGVKKNKDKLPRRHGVVRKPNVSFAAY
jgi:hypothetical protein